MENEIYDLKDIKIEVDGKELKIFERFPDFIPFIGEEYGSGNHKKLLLIWESYYIANSIPEIMRCTDSWYFDESNNDEIKKLFDKMRLKKKGENESGKEDYECHWNFASKMHKQGIDRLFKWKKGKLTKISSSTFQNVEKVLNETTKEEDKNSFKYCAGYNYYLRPASDSSSIKSDKLDEKVARETLSAIIQVLKPDAVIFFSKKANTSFESYKNKHKNVEFKAFVHPACAWWNRKYGKETQKAGKELFKEFIQKFHFNLHGKE